MRRRWVLIAVAILAGTGVAGCSSSDSGIRPAPAPPGCHTGSATVGLTLAAAPPVPVVRTVPGGCVAVSVPRSPFAGSTSVPPRVTPGGRLHLVSDTVQPSGVRVAYYTALRTGTATVSSTVRVETNLAVPEWSGLVLIV